MTKRPASSRQKAERDGRAAEEGAATLLTSKGYEILAQRFRCEEGEIDLIARHGDMIAFIEVKARRTHEAARLSVTDKAIGRITRAAVIWLAHHAPGFDGTVRYDIVAVAPPFPRHYPDAFRPDPGANDGDAGTYF